MRKFLSISSSWSSYQLNDHCTFNKNAFMSSVESALQLGRSHHGRTIDTQISVVTVFCWDHDHEEHQQPYEVDDWDQVLKLVRRMKNYPVTHIEVDLGDDYSLRIDFNWLRIG